MDSKLVKSAVEAKRQIIEGNLTLWNARLDALIALGDVKGALDLIRAPIEDRIDNCGCNVQCGAAQLDRLSPVSRIAGE
jgi:hypothetical protein